jgi:A/G-specific adenine glycosylase
VHKYIAFDLTNIILANIFCSFVDFLTKMFEMEDYRKPLTVWYNHTKRDLPWRESQDPYHIWVSEVILQQTRVQQGLDYYYRFLKLFPDVKSLAAADEEEVLKAWQGLGYYSRARNMHHAAKTIMKEYNGDFPADYSSIRNLKGIGDYTAAAISSIAFGLPHAVVDGNVYRVLSRLFGISTPIDSAAGKKEFSNLAQIMLDTDHPGEFNQSLMELGALQCLPVQPDCVECPLSMKCFAFAHQSIADYPVKSKQVKQRDRYFNYLYLHHSNILFLEKRDNKDIWSNMYQFPLIETPGPSTPEEVITSSKWRNILGKRAFIIENIHPERIHLLTHQRLHIRFFSIRVEDEKTAGHLFSVKVDDLIRYPVPKPVENFLLEKGH